MALRRRRRDIDEHQLGNEGGFGGRDAQRGQSAERHTDDEARSWRPFAQDGPQRLGVELRPVVAVLAPCGAPVSGQVDRQRGQAEAQDDGVPGVCVLPAAMQKHHLGWLISPFQPADVTGSTRLTVGSGRRARSVGVSGNSANSSCSANAPSSATVTSAL